MDKIFQDIMFEYGEAIDKHPKWPTDAIYAAAIVQEECGELIRACVQYKMETGSIEEVKKEAIQTAAMCLRFLYNIDHI